jgi:hypothetical protein
VQWFSSVPKENSELLVALMGSPCLAREEAHVGAEDLHIEVAVGHADVELVHESPAEGVKGTGKGNVALLGETRGHGDHVLLCDTAFHEPVGMEVLEDVQSRRASQVRIQGDDAFVLSCQIG